MATYHYADAPPYQYAPAPAPPEQATYVIPPPPPSAFSPLSPHGVGGEYHGPYSGASPLVVAASPVPSASHSRSNSHARGEYESGGRLYLAPGGYSDGLRRSGSERGRRGGQMVVEGARRAAHSRSRSEKAYYDAPRKQKYYIDDDNYSNYSTSSYGGAGDSRDHSRNHSRHRHHSRTSSCASNESYDDRAERYAVGVYKPKPRSRQEEELTEKLKEVQKQLERVQVDAEKKRLEDDHQRLIEREVQERLTLEKFKDEEKRRKEKEAQEAERRRIADAAKRMLEQQAAQAKAAAEAEEKEKAKIAEKVKEEVAKYSAAQQGKKTYTRFSKQHLCKEALEERAVPFTEEADYFLVHRFVEKAEQQYLWSRTKEIRNYYAQIQEAADNAPTVAAPGGGLVKYVQIAGQPYPMALPVTITHTPGGGQTQRVDPVKIKWSDIFKPK